MDSIKEKSKFLDRLTVEERAVDAKGNTAKRDDFYEKLVEFTCYLCGLSEKCQYYGRKPKFVKNRAVFKDDSYVMVDPFQSRDLRTGTGFLLLGGNCGHCEHPVCIDCSVFYSRRYCVKCAEFYCNEFPAEMQPRIRKLVTAQDLLDEERKKKKEDS